jgi:hypothetical protein
MRLSVPALYCPADEWCSRAMDAERCTIARKPPPWEVPPAAVPLPTPERSSERKCEWDGAGDAPGVVAHAEAEGDG